jgi:predicted esterase
MDWIRFIVVMRIVCHAMSDKGEASDRNEAGRSISRRDFTKAIGGSALLAGAIRPSAAEELGDGSRVTAEELTAEDRITEAFTPSDWMTLGPFQYQYRGGDVSWLLPEGDEYGFSEGETTPSAGQRFQSAYAGGATVTWKSTSASGGTVPLQFSEQIDPTGGDLTSITGGSGLTDSFQDWFGLGGVLYGIGYAFTTFERDQAAVAVVESDATVFLNGERYDETPAAAVLQEGTNYLLVRSLLTLGQGSAAVEFRPPEAAVEVNDPDAFRGTPQNMRLPDLRDGESLDRPGAVRVTNTTPERVEATLSLAPGDAPILGQEVQIDPPLAPFETRRIRVPIRTDGEVSLDEVSTELATLSAPISQSSMTTTALPDEDSVGRALSELERGPDDDQIVVGGVDVTAQQTAASVTVSTGGESHSRDLPLRVRGSDEKKFQTSFVSEYDGSVQVFSVTEPTNPDADGSFELIVTLHGANVPSINQAGAYVQREDTYVVAPNSRGPANYDHENIGRLEDLEVLEEMKSRYDIDESKVYLTGHSMGGHGTWHVGLTHSDEFAAIAPSAGWFDFKHYVMEPFDRDVLYTHPQLRSVKETADYESKVLHKTENAADGTVPVFALHGGQDHSVVSMHPRTAIRSLANRGLEVHGEVGERHPNPNPGAVDAAFLEVPGQGHWWDAGIGPGNDGVNHPDMMSFLRSASNPSFPEEVHFVTANLGVEHKKYWVGVFEQKTEYAPTRVHAELTDDGVEVQTENVSKVVFDLRIADGVGFGSQLQMSHGDDSVELSGETDGLDEWVDGFERPVVVDLEEMTVIDSVGNQTNGPRKRPSPRHYGTLRSVHYQPYRLVYGTQGTDEQTAINRNLANLRSHRLNERAAAPATVVPDTAVDADTMANYNLVLFGEAGTNAVSESLRDGLPIDVEDGAVVVDGRRHEGEFGVEYVYPNPEAPDQMVQIAAGTTTDGLRLTGGHNFVPTFVGTPDYLVYDGGWQFERYNAAVAAGFFDTDWEFSEATGYVRPETEVWKP